MDIYYIYEDLLYNLRKLFDLDYCEVFYVYSKNFLNISEKKIYLKIFLKSFWDYLYDKK